MRRGRGGSGGSFRTIATLTLIPVVGLVVLLLWNMLNGGAPPEQILRIDTQPDAGRLHSAPAASLPSTVTIPTPEPEYRPDVAVPRSTSPLPAVRPKRALGSGAGDMVLIIDDLGFEGQPVRRLMNLDPNISMSVLPNSERAVAIAEQLNSAGYEILCHLPMEPLGRARPGPGALLTSMADDELAELTRRNVAAVPHARGVNNHMGSKATHDPRVMENVLRALPQGMFFIDSRTTGRSVAGATAHSLSIPTATRDVFLDDDATEAAITEQLSRAVEIARSGRTAIVIGHPHAATVAVLERELPRLKAGGLRIVRASEAVK